MISHGARDSANAAAVSRTLLCSSRKFRLATGEVDLKENSGLLTVEEGVSFRIQYNNSCFQILEKQAEVIWMCGKYQVSPL